MKVGFIGLGAMGEPMARNLARAGCLHAAWSRTTEKAAALAAEFGVILASGPADLAQQVDTVLLCVSADSDVLEIIHALLPAIHESSIIVDHSTVSRETACQAAALIRNQGGDFLDAPVTGGVEGARHASLVIMAGGRAEVLAKITPVLEKISRRIVHMGDIGSGQATKAVNQVMVAGINQAVTQALAFGVALGLDMNKVIDVIAAGAAGNWFLDRRGATMLTGHFEPGFKLALHHKDLRICERMAHELGVSLPLVEQTIDDYRLLIASGHGDEDISTLYRCKKPD